MQTEISWISSQADEKQSVISMKRRSCAIFQETTFALKANQSGAKKSNHKCTAIQVTLFHLVSHVSA